MKKNGVDKQKYFGLHGLFLLFFSSLSFPGFSILGPPSILVDQEVFSVIIVMVTRICKNWPMLVLPGVTKMVTWWLGPVSLRFLTRGQIVLPRWYTSPVLATASTLYNNKFDC